MTHVFKHPKYWAELRAEKRKLKAPSLKQVIQETVPWNEVVEASSSKPQASSLKPQAASAMKQTQLKDRIKT